MSWDLKQLPGTKAQLLPGSGPLATLGRCLRPERGGMGGKTSSPFEELSGVQQRSGLCLSGKWAVFLEGSLWTRPSPWATTFHIQLEKKFLILLPPKVPFGVCFHPHFTLHCRF